jgi:hypothetical protein
MPGASGRVPGLSRSREWALFLQEAEEFLGSVAYGTDIRWFLAVVDIPADDAFPTLRHRKKL